jgi:hypothetical protein
MRSIRSLAIHTAPLVAVALVVVALPAGAQQYELSYNPEAGKPLHYLMTMTQKMKMDMGAMGVQEMVSTNRIGSTLVAEKTDSGFDVATTFDSMAIEVEQGGRRVMSYDSTAPDTSSSELAMLGGMVEKSFIMSINERGEVTGVRGMEAVWESLAAGDAQSGMVIDQLKQGMGDSQMGEMMQAGMAVYPGKPVAIGDSWDWSTTSQNPMIGEMGIDMDYTLVGPTTVDGRECLSIDVEVEMTITGNGAMLEQMMAMSGGTGSFEMNDVAGKGTLCVAADTGAVVASDITQVIGMTIKMDAGNGPQEMKIDIDQRIEQSLRD